MRQLHKKRALSPNNVLWDTKRIAKGYGFTIPKGSKGRIIVNNKEYTLTYTSYKLTKPEARQYDTSSAGLVTLWLADGNFYIYDRFELSYKSTTREFGPSEFVQLDAKNNTFDTKHLLDNAKVQNKHEYKLSVKDGISDACIDKEEILTYLR